MRNVRIFSPSQLKFPLFPFSTGTVNGASYKWPVRYLGELLLHGLLCDTNLLTFLTYFNYKAIKSEIITFSNILQRIY